jgi:hypothetical protein
VVFFISSKLIEPCFLPKQPPTATFDEGDTSVIPVTLYIGKPFSIEAGISTLATQVCSRDVDGSEVDVVWSAGTRKFLLASSLSF